MDVFHWSTTLNDSYVLMYLTSCLLVFGVILCVVYFCFYFTHTAMELEIIEQQILAQKLKAMQDKKILQQQAAEAGAEEVALENGTFISQNCLSWASDNFHIIVPCDNKIYNNPDEINWDIQKDGIDFSYHLATSEPSWVVEPTNIYDSSMDGGAGLDVSLDYEVTYPYTYSRDPNGFTLGDNPNNADISDFYSNLYNYT